MNLLANRLLLVLSLAVGLAGSLRAQTTGVSTISFTTSGAQFQTGDSITIREVLASSTTFSPGVIVVVRGDYKLQSHSSASLQLNLTTSPGSGPTTTPSTARLSISSAGSGSFELQTTIQATGSLHVSFYDTVSSFGGVYFAPAGSPPVNSGGGTTTTTTPAVISTDGLSPITFATTKPQFQSGDSITIQQVLGTSSQLQPGDRVVVRGTYQLQSADRAMLLLTLTAFAPGASENISPTSRKDVTSGTGTFELEYTIQQPGALHVSFYPATSGSVFGGIYFGTTASVSATTVALATPATNTGRLANISTRGLVGSGDNAMVVGFTVTEQERYVLIRGVGPTLASFGVTNALRKPALTVYDSAGHAIASTGSWSTSYSATQRSGLTMVTSAVGAFPLASNSDDAVLNLRFTSGSYTVMMSSADSQTAVALLEVYASPSFTLPLGQ